MQMKTSRKDFALRQAAREADLEEQSATVVCRKKVVFGVLRQPAVRRHSAPGLESCSLRHARAADDGDAKCI